MPSALVVNLMILGTACAILIAIYHFVISYKIDRKDTIDLLRQKGIGDRPETITKNYYKTQGENLDEKQVRKKTKEFIKNNKEFFLTMYDVTNKHKRETNESS